MKRCLCESWNTTAILNASILFVGCYSYIIFSLPVRASKQGNVIGLVSVYIYIYKKKL